MNQSIDGDENVILALLERWRSAIEAKDVAAVLELCADDVVFLPSSGAPVKGKAAVETMYGFLFAQYGKIHQDTAIEEVQVAGDWAFLWGTHELRLTPDSGSPLHLRGQGLSVLKRQPDSTWKLWRGINNMTRQST
ncbi:MAG TPA: SgcJ/EcaC family oxidoreductase [Bryobacteraceae bacterium]|nr:SgcJ/EcaC family oxidoreductase [Bryobacteraceae bacterium]